MDISSSNTRPVSTPAGWLDRFVASRLRATLDTAKGLAISIRLPSGYRFRVGDPGADALDWRINRWNTLFRVLNSGALGFAEGYIQQEWDSAALPALLSGLANHLDGIETAQARRSPSRFLARLRHWRNDNTKSGSRRNIAFHYDLGNAFYARWLDPSMTYSSAIFEHLDEDLEAAQTRKYRRICERLELKPGQHVLEIGCGWGGFAEIAARDFGCRVTGVTLSREQLAFAEARMDAAGLSDQVELRLQDYRDIEGEFDAIASIEMFEAVGEAHWDTFFARALERLRPGGKASMQVITIREQDFDGYRKAVDFIQKYVFPGGMLPPVSRLEALAGEAGFETVDRHMFGPSYAETLRRWHQAYVTAWPELQHQGFDDRFDRIWRFYLAYCEAGFDAGRIDVGQFTFRKPEA